MSTPTLSDSLNRWHRRLTCKVSAMFHHNSTKEASLKAQSLPFMDGYARRTRPLNQLLLNVAHWSWSRAKNFKRLCTRCTPTYVLQENCVRQEGTVMATLKVCKRVAALLCMKPLPSSCLV